MSRLVGRCAGHLSLTPLTRCHSVVATEGGREGVGRAITGAGADLRQGQLAGMQMISRQGHAPLGQVSHRRLTERQLKDPCERGAGQPAYGCELRHRPTAGGVSVHGIQGGAEPRIDRSLIPARRIVTSLETRPNGQDQQNVKESVEHSLLAGSGVGELG